MKKYGKMNTGKMRIQHVANQNVVFKFFPDADIKLENIGVMDIVDGTPTPVLGLIWSASGGASSDVASSAVRRLSLSRAFL